MDIWPLTLKVDLDISCPKYAALKIHIHNKYQVSISTGSKVMAQTLNLTCDLAEWPWHMMVPLKTCGFMRYTCTPNITSLSPLDQKLWPKLFIWPLTLKNDLDLMMLPLKMYSLVIFTCTPNIKYLSLLDQMLWPMWPIYLTFDLEGWPWPWHITP